MASKYKPVEIEGGGAAAEAAAAAGSPRTAHTAFILCSASTLVPWMAYISSLDYFMMLLPGMGIQYVVPCVYANAYCATPPSELSIPRMLLPFLHAPLPSFVDVTHARIASRGV
jgi:hypothetical protein